MTGRRCRMCGCTETTPCPTPEGFCHWVGPNLCSACAQMPTGFVEWAGTNEEEASMPAGFVQRESGLAVPEPYDDGSGGQEWL